MSNRVALVSTKFTNLSDGSETFGFRMYDDYGTMYDNLLESPITDDLELLKYAFNNCRDSTYGIFDYIIENEKGVEINGSWYDYEEVKDIITSCQPSKV